MRRRSKVHTGVSLSLVYHNSRLTTIALGNSQHMWNFIKAVYKVVQILFMTHYWEIDKETIGLPL